MNVSRHQLTPLFVTGDELENHIAQEKELEKASAKNYPSLTPEQIKESEEFVFPLTISKWPVKEKATNAQQWISFIERNSVRVRDFVEYVRTGHIYANCIVKPFNRNHPEKGYHCYETNEAFGRKFISYFHFYSANIITFDIDKFWTSATLEEIYKSIYECRPTFMYTTSSDCSKHQGNKALRCFRLVYVFDKPIYAKPISPVWSKEDKKYIWDEKDNSSARRAANETFSQVYNMLKSRIGLTDIDFFTHIDKGSVVAVQTYNGNGKSNFEVVGDYQIYHLDDFLNVEDNVPYEPISNFQTPQYLKYVEQRKTEREHQIKISKPSAKQKYRAHKNSCEELTKYLADNVNYGILDLHEVEKGDGKEINANIIFEEKGLSLSKFSSNKMFSYDRYKFLEVLKSYQLCLDEITNDVPQNIIPTQCVLTSEEFLACTQIDQCFKSDNIRRDVTITFAPFLEDFYKLNYKELLLKYKALYPNVWQNYSLDYTAQFDFPDGYMTIFKVLEWRYNSLVKHQKHMQMQDGSGRKRALRRLAIARVLLNEDITYDNLLFNVMVDMLFVTSSKGSSSDITKQHIIDIVNRVWSISEDDDVWDKIGNRISEHPLSHNIYQKDQKAEAMAMGRRKKSSALDEQILLYYDQSLKDKENLALLRQNGIEIKRSKLQNWKKKFGLQKNQKQKYKDQV